MGLIDLTAGEQADLGGLLSWYLNAEDAPELDESHLQVISRITSQISNPPPVEREWLIIFDYEDGECGHAIVRGDEERADNTLKMLNEIHAGASEGRVIDITRGDDFDATLEEWMDLQVQNQEDGIEP